jgi:hypothetical protein
MNQNAKAGVVFLVGLGVIAVESAIYFSTSPSPSETGVAFSLFLILSTIVAIFGTAGVLGVK